MPEVFIYLVRHGQTMFNYLHKAQGWVDSPLTQQGRNMAAELGRGLGREGVRFVSAVSSDSGRAAATARLILDHNGQADLPLRQDPRLREWCMGRLEECSTQLLADAIHKSVGRVCGPGEMDHLLPQMADYLHWNVDDRCQTFDQITARLLSGLGEAAEEAQALGGGNVLVVSHGLAIKSLLWHLAPESIDDIGMLRNTSVCRFRYQDGHFTPLVLNDVHYLDGSAARTC